DPKRIPLELHKLRAVSPAQQLGPGNAHTSLVSGRYALRPKTTTTGRPAIGRPCRTSHPPEQTGVRPDASPLKGARSRSERRGLNIPDRSDPARPQKM